MLIDDLIKLLEEEKKNQDKFRDIFGEPTIGLWTHKGFVHDFSITHTPDGVYALLIADVDFPSQPPKGVEHE